MLRTPACDAFGTPRQEFSQDHFPLTTEGANSGVLPRNPSQQVFPGFLGGFLRLFIFQDPQKLLAAQKLLLAASIT
jgi:hypothetical protein